MSFLLLRASNTFVLQPGGPDSEAEASTEDVSGHENKPWL